MEGNIKRPNCRREAYIRRNIGQEGREVDGQADPKVAVIKSGRVSWGEG